MATSFGEFDKLREDNKLEFKSAKGGFPSSFWETYSAFSNTDGGIVVLGAKEGPDGLPQPSGLSDPHKLCKELWDALNNRKKVSANTLVNDDVIVEEVGGAPVVIVRVPRASRELRPVFINGDMLGGSYRRNGEGDYHCTRREINAMVRDSYPSDIDKRVLDNIGMDALNMGSVRAYRQEFRYERADHPWVDLEDEAFLLRLGAIGRSGEDGRLHPTHAGLLMFGEDWRITDEYPEYFLDCRQVLGGERWDNRIVSSSGDWSGNVYDFYRRAYRMLADGLPVPFALDKDMRRIDDTPQHKGVREALANALIHADYYDRCGIVAIRYDDRVEIRNPGMLRMSADEVVAGGMSDARNGTLMKMFNLIGVGEKAGSGFDVMRASTVMAGKPDPTIAERHEPDLVTLVLPLETSGARYAQARGDRLADPHDPNLYNRSQKQAEKQADNAKTSGKLENKRKNKRKAERQTIVLELAQAQGAVSSREISELLGVSNSRARAIANEMVAAKLLNRRGDGPATRYVPVDSRGE